jgi:hypothetical protein
MSLLVGLVAGIFGGLVGIGGGAIMIPLMVRFFKFSQHQGHGTSLMALVFTGISGAVTYGLKGSVDVLAAVLLASSAIFTARLGALYANALPEWRLKRAFGIFLLSISMLVLSKPYLSHLAALSHLATGWAKVVTLLAAGVMTGFLSGMMGVGGGAIMVAAMVLLVGYSQHTAQGSALLAMVPAGSVGAYTHWRLGNVVTRVLAGLIVGIIIGTYLGSSLALLLTDANLRLVFTAVLFWLGIRDIRGAYKIRPAAATRAQQA